MALKETSELIDVTTDTAIQGVVSFSDGWQVKDIADFFDEAMDWPSAIQGLAVGFPAEAKIATPNDIEEMFERQRVKLLEKAKMNPLLAGAIVTHLKGIYYTYCAIVQAGAKVVG